MRPPTFLVLATTASAAVLMLLACGTRDAEFLEDGAWSGKADDTVNADTDAPRVVFEYGYGLDHFCSEHVEPETLLDWQVALVPALPNYAGELVGRLDEFAEHWDSQASRFLATAVDVVGISFERQEYTASLFLCPRLPSMGRPLAINVISYLESSAPDIPIIDEPLHIFFFGTITFHELLHKYVNQLLRDRPSQIVLDMNEPMLVERHLHVFTLQKRAFEALGMFEALEAVGRQEASHGPDYVRAWTLVHSDSEFEQRLFDELLPN